MEGDIYLRSIVVGTLTCAAVLEITLFRVASVHISMNWCKPVCNTPGSVHYRFGSHPVPVHSRFSSQPVPAQLAPRGLGPRVPLGPGPSWPLGAWAQGLGPGPVGP